MCEISIIIPVYNAGPYLLQCIDSVLFQNIHSEIILINDGSTDKSPDICFDYSKEFPNIHYINLEHGGVSAARNVGINMAKGKYVLFLDSDDYLLPGALNKLCKTADDHRADMVIGNYKYMYGRHVIPANPRMVSNSYSQFESIHFTCIGGNKIIRRDLLKNNGIKYPDLRTGEDLTFYHACLSKCNRIIGITEDIFVYRMHEGSASKTYDDKIFDFIKAFQLIEDIYKDKPDMKLAFSFDKMFYVHEQMKKIRRYQGKKNRYEIFEKMRKIALETKETTIEAEDIRSKILKMNRYLYCGNIPTAIYRFLRKCKHIVRGD